MLRPLSIPEMFDEMFSLYRSNFLLFAGIVGLVTLPVVLLSAFWLSDLTDANLAQAGPDDLQSMLFNLYLLLFFAWLADVVAIAALTKAVSERYLGHRVSILGSYRFALARFFPFIFTMILVGITTGIGLLLLVIPGVVFLFMFALVNPVFVVEGETFASAMGRSRDLARENWFKILLIYIVLFVLNWLTGLASEGLTNALVGSTLTGTGVWLSVFLETVLAMLVQPIGLIGFVLLYFDIRVRKEGYDLEMLASDMGADAGAAASASF